MKNFCLILICIVTAIQFTCLAQNTTSGHMIAGNNNFVDPRLEKLSLSSNSAMLTYEDIDGTPYIDNYTGASNNLPIGKFYSPDFEYMETALARYNAYTDNIEVSLLEDGLDYYIFAKKPDFLYAVLGKTTYRAYEYDNLVGFFVILSKDDNRKCVLLKKERISFKREEKAASSFVSGTPDMFRRIRDLYYFKIKDVLVEIPRKKKDFFNLFNEQKDAIKKYVGSNRLKITKEKDLLKISEYYNSLLK